MTTEPSMPDRDDPQHGDGRTDSPLSRSAAREGGPAGPFEAGDSAVFANHLTLLAGDLSAALTGSARRLDTVSRRMAEGRVSNGTDLADDVGHVSEGLAEIARFLATTIGAPSPSEHGASDPWASGLGDRASLADAIEHAAEVVVPMGLERRIRVSCTIDPELDEVPAGPVYVAIAAGVHNSMDALLQGGRPGGLIQVRATISEHDGRRVTVIEISDDGSGVGDASLNEPQMMFDPRFSTKTGVGIGLPLARSVVESLGGVIELVTRDAPPEASNPGARLRIELPLPERTIGEHE